MEGTQGALVAAVTEGNVKEAKRLLANHQAGGKHKGPGGVEYSAWSQTNFKCTGGKFSPLIAIALNADLPMNRKVAMMDMLFKQGADPNVEVPDAGSLLHLAISKCSLEPVRLILSYGSKGAAVLQHMLGHVDSSFCDYLPPISFAARHALNGPEGLSILQAVAEYETDVNRRDKTGSTPYMWTLDSLCNKVENKGCSPERWLQEPGLAVNRCDAAQNICLFLASHEGYTNHEVKCRLRQWTALQWTLEYALKNPSVLDTVARKLLERGAPVPSKRWINEWKGRMEELKLHKAERKSLHTLSDLLEAKHKESKSERKSGGAVEIEKKSMGAAAVSPPRTPSPAKGCAAPTSTRQTGASGASADSGARKRGRLSKDSMKTIESGGEIGTDSGLQKRQKRCEHDNAKRGGADEDKNEDDGDNATLSAGSAEVAVSVKKGGSQSGKQKARKVPEEEPAPKVKVELSVDAARLLAQLAKEFSQKNRRSMLDVDWTKQSTAECGQVMSSELQDKKAIIQASCRLGNDAENWGEPGLILKFPSSSTITSENLKKILGHAQEFLTCINSETRRKEKMPGMVKMEEVEIREVPPNDPRGMPPRSAMLLAARELPRHTVLGLYAGRVRFDEARADPFVLHEYALRLTYSPPYLGKPLELDPCDDTFNALTCINDPRGSGKRSNCQFLEVLEDGWPWVFVMTSARVKKGEELLLDYGPKYWKYRADFDQVIMGDSTDSDASAKHAASLEAMCALASAVKSAGRKR